MFLEFYFHFFTFFHFHVCLCMCACLHVWCVCLHVCVGTYTYVRACLHVCADTHYISLCVHVRVCAHIRNLKLITRSILHYFSTLFPEAGPHSQTQRSPIWPVILDSLLCGSYLSLFKARITWIHSFCLTVSLGPGGPDSYDRCWTFSPALFSHDNTVILKSQLFIYLRLTLFITEKVNLYCFFLILTYKKMWDVWESHRKHCEVSYGHMCSCFWFLEVTFPLCGVRLAEPPQ